MKIKSILLLMLALCLTVCLCACSSDDSGKKDDQPTTTTASADNSNSTVPSTEATVPTTAPSVSTPITETTPSVTEPSQPEEGKANYTITVVDEAGNPVPGAMVQMCDDSSCLLPMSTNAQGVVTYDNKEETTYSVKFATVPEGYVLPRDDQGEPASFYFDDGSYEITIVLKAAN